jgi:hypothetical protein
MKRTLIKKVLAGILIFTYSTTQVFGFAPDVISINEWQNKPVLPLMLEAIPLANADIREISPSPNDNHPLVLIQDVHLIREAQSNIAATIESLIKSQTVTAIGLEGVFSPLDFSRLKSFSDQNAMNQVAIAFLQNNQLAAPSYVGITPRFLFWELMIGHTTKPM